MTSTLGKRKERDEGHDGLTHGFTLFVSNLPYSATSVDLQTLFSDIAPVRSAFVVTESSSGLSKGVGYVSFTVKEDAQMAYDTIMKDGLSLVGRKLRLQWAENKKPKDHTEAPEVVKEFKARRPPQPQQIKAPHDPLAIRTIVISGLSSSIDSKVLWKKVRKYAGAEKVDWPVESATDDINNTAHVLFNTPAAASDAISKLHGHVYKGHLLSVTLKKRLDTLSKISTKQTTSRIAAPSHASRLIVRNLPFSVTEQDLRAVFLPYGPIYSIHIPTTDNKQESNANEPIKTKGFAFVWMLSKKDAESAIKGCNGTTITAGSAQALVNGKHQRKKQRREEEKKLKVAASTGEEGTADTVNDDNDERKIGAQVKIAAARVVAVDWALSKEKWEEEKTKMEGDAEADDVSNAEDVGSSSQNDENSDDDDGEEALGVHNDDDSASENDDETNDKNEETEERMKPSLPPPETGTTLFIRNVSFSTTEDELRILFRPFGPLRYARITVDHETGRSRGTGFVCFWNKEDADKVITQSNLLRAETTGISALPKKNPFSMPSILMPDPSSTLAQSLVLHGRTLGVVRAVTRDEAGKLREEGERMRAKSDKRNMYLLREGIILPNTPASETLATEEIERRTTSFNARRALLRSNPSLFISKTRLSIRQIPIFVTERMLKRLAIHAIKSFEAEVKSSSRAPLAVEELEDFHDDSLEGGNAKGKKKDSSGRRTGVKQAKIVRQLERVDPILGTGRSKGYGFLEMYTHADALRVLRWANNNTDTLQLFEEWWKEDLKDRIKLESAKETLDDNRLSRLKNELERGTVKKSRRTLIVEFSIENIQVVQRRNTSQQKQKSENNKPLEPKLKKEEPFDAKDGRGFQSGKRPKKSQDWERLAKKPRISTDAQTGKNENPHSNTSFILGRKRKERKMKKRAAN